jgi:hypothetical protein
VAADCFGRAILQAAPLFGYLALAKTVNIKANLLEEEIIVAILKQLVVVFYHPLYINTCSALFQARQGSNYKVTARWKKSNLCCL